MFNKIGVWFFLLAAVLGDKDDKKWVWGESGRSSKENLRNSDSSASARYEVYENENYPNRPGFQQYQERPLNDGPFPTRPLDPGPDGPIFPPNERPGGVYGPQNFENANYGQGHGSYNNVNTYHPEDGILTGPVPSWVKQGPIKQFDRCKCSEKFNCNSPGISYGHCDVGKQYCCWSIKKSSQIGGPIPSRPINSPENGILAGPGQERPFGPAERPLGPAERPFGPAERPFVPERPPNYRPSGRPVEETYYPGNPGNTGGYRPGRPFRPSGGNIHSLQNGVLIGPGGPFDLPHGGGFGAVGGFGRSKKD
ncbi:uncharacterized protein LOC109604241 [Aethina tumida]|uniref:uncharacterized protein LOC109604241 n=1 Tax=Aethina tumida TaxID=116153 RepID=UPI0021496048|nr:uncharacterized protein LOC109604241 [Aethina tumida]